jgi:hypothetical protein
MISLPVRQKAAGGWNRDRRGARVVVSVEHGVIVVVVSPEVPADFAVEWTG